MQSILMTSRPLLGLMAFLSAGVASADTLTITFVQVAQAAVATPTSPWLAAAIALGIVLIALAIFRRKGTQRFFLLGAGLVIGAGGLIVEKDVSAISVIPLVTSPYTESFTFCTLSELFTSGTGGTIRITGVTDDGVPNGSILDGTTTCAPGTILTPTTNCRVGITTPAC